MKNNQFDIWNELKHLNEIGVSISLDTDKDDEVMDIFRPIIGQKYQIVNLTIVSENKEYYEITYNDSRDTFELKRIK